MSAIAGLRSALMVTSCRAHLVPALIHRPARPFLQTRAVYTSQPAMSMASSASKVNIYTDYSVYKGKGAVTFKVIRPTWTRVPNGSGISVSREGTVLLEFAHAVAERTYDWEKKGTFALSALECAEVLESLETKYEKSFVHDPSKGASDEGQVIKNLKVAPTPQGGGFFLNLAVTERGAKATYSTVLSSAEARLVRRLLDFAIPRILGFEEIFQGPPDVRDGTEQQAPF